MSPAFRVWVTRAEPGASATAARLQSIGLQTLVAPLLAVRPLETKIDLGGVAALAFTSINGVEIYAAREPGRDLPVFTVGDATAGAAGRAGFTDVRSAGGGVGDLGRLIVREKPQGAVLHPGGRERAGDLAGYLERHGVEATQVALYDTPAVEALSADALEALRERRVSAVLLHSPRAATILADLVRGFDLSDIIALGLSSHCLRPVSRLAFAAFVQAQRPEESALLDALLVALGNPAGPR